MSPILVYSVPTAAGLALVGLVLLAWGIRGRRVDKHPVCRRCGFDLFGLPQGSAVCSECGADLNGRRAVRVGRRERRRRAIAWSMPPMLLGLGWLGVLGWATASGVDWNRHKPAWLLVREADSTNPAVRDPAINELTGRLERGALPRSIVDIVQDKALAYQADVRRPWAPAWGALIESSRLANKLSSERWHRYLAQGAGLTLEARPRVRRGDPLPVRLVRGPARVSNPANVRTVLELRFDQTLQIGKEVVAVPEPDQWRRREIRVAGGRTNPPDVFLEVPAEIPAAVLARLPDGPQTVRVVAEVLPVPQPAAARATRVRPPPQSRRPAALTPAPPPPDERLRIRVELEAPWTLTPADQPSVALTADPSLRSEVERSLGLPNLDYDIQFQTPRLTGHLSCQRPPVALSFEALVRVRFAGQLRGGSVACAAGEQVDADVVAQVPGPGMESSTVDVVLRPNPRQAARTVDVEEIWGEDVVLKDVPVRYPNAGMATSP